MIIMEDDMARQKTADEILQSLDSLAEKVSIEGRELEGYLKSIEKAGSLDTYVIQQINEGLKRKVENYLASLKDIVHLSPADMDVDHTAPERDKPPMICEHCSAPRDEEAQFCSQCGQEVEREPVTESTLTCTGCGKILPGDSCFCSKCGTRLEMPKPEPLFCPECGKTKGEGKFCISCGFNFQGSE